MKNNKILETIVRFLSGFVDQFKMKNPQAFAIIGVILYGIWSALDNGLQTGALQDVEVTVLGMSFFVLDFASKAIVFILMVLGAHTPQQALQVPQPVLDWTKDDEYHPGDKAKQATLEFVCLKNHIAAPENQPLLDVEGKGEFWKRAE